MSKWQSRSTPFSIVKNFLKLEFWMILRLFKGFQPIIIHPKKTNYWLCKFSHFNFNGKWLLTSKPVQWAAVSFRFLGSTVFKIGFYTEFFIFEPSISMKTGFFYFFFDSQWNYQFLIPFKAKIFSLNWKNAKYIPTEFVSKIRNAAFHSFARNVSIDLRKFFALHFYNNNNNNHFGTISYPNFDLNVICCTAKGKFSLTIDGMWIKII